MSAGEEGPTVSLVLETNNLQNHREDIPEVVRELELLIASLVRQTRPLGSLAEVVITHHGISHADQSRLAHRAAAPLRFLHIPPGAGYYQAKNLGFDATTAEVVAFGDGDCRPEPAWLERLVAPFADPRVEVVAGRTTYGSGALAEAATAVDFLYYPSPFGAGCTRSFYANNVAFRRATFARHRFAAMPASFHGACGLLGMRLVAEGTPVRFAADARTRHPLPATPRELLEQRLLRGSDAAALTPHAVASVVPHAPEAIRSGRLAPLGLLAARLVYGATTLGLTDVSRAPGIARGARVAVACALSAVDMAGALAHRAVVSHYGVVDGLLHAAR